MNSEGKHEKEVLNWESKTVVNSWRYEYSGKGAGDINTGIKVMFHEFCENVLGR